MCASLSSRCIAVTCLAFLAFALPISRIALGVEPEEQEAISPQQAAAEMRVPPGFHVSLFAGEPDVIQPIAMTIDDRGRLWVVECFSYPHWSKDGSGHDRVAIFSDHNGDGQFDEKKIFWDQGSNLSGIAVGFGGVWLCSTPNFIFIPDRDGDDHPDADPEILLDGWSLEAKHNVFNGLTWGPDGWLYGCHGILAVSHVGKPGTSANERVPFDCGVWRYHPTRHEFEIFAWGTTNPWGLDFDEYGQMFITNCVIPHLFHVMPGAHFVRMYGEDLNSRAYGLLESCADHIHWAGGFWKTSLGGKHAEAGGGHAHAGAMIYLGDNWPQEYRGNLFTLNIHGRRANRDLLVRQDSGYVATHGKDFLFSSDPWFRGLEMIYGPDGGVYVTDWHDTGECHDYENTQKSTGRIFKVCYGSTSLRPVNLAGLDEVELLELLGHKNHWYQRTAQRILQERAALGPLDRSIAQRLKDTLVNSPVTAARLRALLPLHVIEELTPELLLTLLNDSDEHLRAWAIRLVTENGAPSADVAARLEEMAGQDSSSFVRLHLAAGLQKLPSADSWTIATNLLERADDIEDDNLPLMVWYGIESLIPDANGGDATLLAAAANPLHQEFIARTMAASGDEAIQRLVDCLRESDREILFASAARGMVRSLRGHRDLKMPNGWQSVAEALFAHPHAKARNDGLMLSLLFGDLGAAQRAQEIILDSSQRDEVRVAALDALLEVSGPDIVPLLHDLLDDQVLRAAVLRGLGAFEHSRTPGLILNRYQNLTKDEHQIALSTLASREDYAIELVSAIESGSVPGDDLTAYAARQLRSYGNPEINRVLLRHWGDVRATSQEKNARIADYKSIIGDDYLSAADRVSGRVLFEQHCAKCHRLFDSGGSVGPDLTGSQRSELDYLFENLLDPSAIVPREYKLSTFVMSDGRVIQGIRYQENDQAIEVQTENSQVLLPKNEIVSAESAELSMMPEGILDQLNGTQIRDLIAYLAGESQVPLDQ